MLLIKPHHLLDIFKLYGVGDNAFIPNPIYGHDFHRIGNIVLKNPNIEVKFTVGCDDICKPCKFNINNECVDSVTLNPQKYRSKNYWNQTIDKRLMKVLCMKEGTRMTVLDFCKLAMEKIHKNTIVDVWSERPIDETKKRAFHLLKGVKKYCKKNHGEAFLPEINQIASIDKIAFIYINNKRILMTLSKGKDTYYIPGGKREGNETDEQTLAREVQEELTVKIIPHTMKYYGTFEAQAHGKPEGTIVRMTCYTAEFKGELKPSNEILDIAYYAYAQRNIVGPVDQIIFDDLKIKGLIL